MPTRMVEREDVSDFLSVLCEDDVHAKRVQSMANATVGVLANASLGVHAIGQGSIKTNKRPFPQFHGVFRGHQTEPSTDASRGCWL